MSGSATTTPQVETAPKPAQPAGLIQDLERLLGKPLSPEARRAIETTMVNVLNAAMQTAVFTAEATSEISVEMHRGAAKKVNDLISQG